MRVLTLLAALVFTTTAQAQWQMQDAHTSADLRGIHNLGGGVAWASGTDGTVLRTEDAGFVWQLCAIPPGAEHLDFRGIQGFDHDTAIVMSSGKGDLSRLYKTSDGCQSWKRIFTNPYGEAGFFDAILFIDKIHGILLSDPTPFTINTPTESGEDFRVRVTDDAGATWAPVTAPDSSGKGHGLHPLSSESAFAASNSAIAAAGNRVWFATSAARVFSRDIYSSPQQLAVLFHSHYCAGQIDSLSGECGQPWTDFTDSMVPIDHSAESAGIFSISFRTAKSGNSVGGDYLQANKAFQTAAFTLDGGKNWAAATTPPHGYRSAVAYDPTHKAWITVGPNGTDISTDDGRNWRALKPAPGDQPDADRNWNALSLPYVVGPHGRIATLRPEAVK